MSSIKSVNHGSLLWSVVTKIGLVILFIILFRVWFVAGYLINIRQSRDVVLLKDFSAQIAQHESHLFINAEENLRQLSQIYFEQLKNLNDKNNQDSKDILYESNLNEAFNKKFILSKDGITRVNPAFVNVANEAHTFIDSKTKINSNIKAKMLLQHELISNYGKAWNQNFISTFMASSDGIYSNYWSGIDWSKTGIPETNFYSLAWASVQEQNQGFKVNQPIWTDIWYDKISSGWLLNCILASEDRFKNKIHVGISIRMNELVQRLSTLHLENAYSIILSPSGDLIAHPQLMQKISEMNGKFNVKKYHDNYLYELYSFVHNFYQTHNPKSLDTFELDFDKYNEIVVVTKINGPNWYLINSYAKDQSAYTRQTAINSLLVNFCFLIIELTLMFYLLKRALIMPLNELTHITHDIVSTGQVNTKLPTHYKFELQSLADAFSVLLRFIHDRDSKLIEANSQLEKINTELETKVLLRTNELNLKNTTLQQEIFARETLNELITNERLILELIASRNPLSQILAKICTLIEKQISDSICCIMLVDDAKNELLIGASPRMPEIFLHKLHRAPIVEDFFTCSTAVFLGKRVITKEIKNNHSWNEILKLTANDIKLKSCWSTPIIATSKILGEKNKIIGTLGIYHKNLYHPIQKDFSIVDRILQLCAVAIERDHVERKLTSSEEIYRTVFESVNDGIILFSVNNGSVIDANARVSLILGYDLDELKATTNLNFMSTSDEDDEDVLHEYTLAKIWQHFQFALMGKTQIFEWHFPLKNKGFSWLEITFKQAFIHGQIMILAVIKDINQRKLSEKLLIDSEENYRTIFDFANDAIIVHDPEDGQILDLNQKATELLECGTLRTTQLSDFTCLCTLEYKEKYNCDQYLQHLQDAFNQGEKIFEWLGSSHDGTIIWLEISLKRTSIHGFPRILAVIRDITERKKAEELIHQQNGQLTENVGKLEQLNQDKNDFLGIAAHDLKNPLNSITLTADMLIDEFEDFSQEEIIRYLNQVKHSSNRMLIIINELLDINRIECGKLALKSRQFNLTALVQECLKNYEKQAERKSIKIHVDFNNTYDVYADFNSCYEIVENLISNAIKYSQEGKNIHIMISEIIERNTIRFAVKDEGPGISTDEQQLLFQKFTKLSARPTAGEHSTGLGLSIVKKLVEYMNGTVFCESELNQGSTFGFELPKDNSKMI